MDFDITQVVVCTTGKGWGDEENIGRQTGVQEKKMGLDNTIEQTGKVIKVVKNWN